MRISSGDRAAFNELFERHRAELRRMVQLRIDGRLKSRIDPSDVVQDAQFDAYRRLDDYLLRRPMPFGLWLRKTAQERLLNLRRNNVQAACRSVRREQALPDRSSLLIAAPLLRGGSSPGRRVEAEEYKRLIGEAVGQLAEIDREILLMRNVEGLSQREIAQILDLNHDAVRKRYGRAIVKLERLLAAKGLSEAEP
jgi:RNA polymerase sigma-70 factor (ECF subfamily)